MKASLLIRRALSWWPAAIAILLLPVAVLAQQHFVCNSNTEDSYPVVIESVTINDVPLSAGDEIAVFTDAGLCVGATTVGDTVPVVLTAWEDDSFTSEIDGYRTGEIMLFRVWDVSSQLELPMDVIMIQGNGTFGNGPFAVAALSLSFNYPPRITLQSNYAIDEDKTLEIDLSLNVSDENHGAQAIQWMVSPGTNVLSSITSMSLLRFEPTLNWFGSESFEIIATDPGGASDTAIVEIVVLSVNDVPVLELPAEVTIAEDDSSVVISIDSWARDVETASAALQWQFAPASANLAIAYDALARTLRLLPAPDYYGNTSLAVTVIDGDSAMAMGTLPVTVTAVPDPPSAAVLLSPINGAEVSDSSEVNLRWRASFDPDGEVVSYEATYDVTRTLNQIPVVITSSDTSAKIQAGSLQSNTWYFWQVRTSDGIHLVTSEVDSFRTAVRSKVAEQPALPTSFALEQNYPNPFFVSSRGNATQETTIRFSVPKPSEVTITVYNYIGQVVQTLVSENVQPGTHQLEWNGRDAAGRSLPSGIYWMRMTSGSFTATRKMLLFQ